MASLSTAQRIFTRRSLRILNSRPYSSSTGSATRVRTTLQVQSQSSALRAISRCRSRWPESLKLYPSSSPPQIRRANSSSVEAPGATFKSTSSPATPTTSDPSSPASPFSSPPSPDTTTPEQFRDVPHYHLTFTCKPCSTRSSHHISKTGYHNGTVLITCPSCKARHLIADHLKIFSDTSKTLEDILREKSGEDVVKGRVGKVDGDLGELGDIEWWRNEGAKDQEEEDKERELS